MIGLEAVELADAAGVPLDKLLTVMKRNGVLTPPAQGFVAFCNDPTNEPLRLVLKTQAGIGEKDLLLAEALAAGADTTVPLASSVRAMIRRKIIEVCERGSEA